MPPVLYRGAAVCLAAVTLFACKPRQDSSSAVKADAAAGSPTKLAFDHTVLVRTVGFLSGHFDEQGCAEAANWLLLPKGNDFPGVIAAINASDRVYETVVANVLDPSIAIASCSTDPVGQRSDASGMYALNEMVNGKGFGLTVIVMDGVASLFTPDGPIAEARTEWAKLAKTAKGEPLKVEHMTLGEFTTIENAKTKIQSEWQQLVEKEGEKRRFLIWAPDVAGNIALELLANNRTLRDRTIGLVTLGSPLGGMVHSMFSERIKGQMDKLSGSVAQLAAASLAPQIAKYTANMTELASLTPESRQPHLRKLMAGDFSRNDDGFGKKTRIYHVVSAIDPANLSPLPLATMNGTQVSAKMTTRSMEQSILLPFLSSLKDEPLSDGLVSLQNAVIPQAMASSSTEVNVIALTTFDNYGLQLTRRADDTPANTPPYAKIVDSFIESISTTYGGFVETHPESASDEPAAAKTCATAKRPVTLDSRWTCVEPCKWVCSTCEAEAADPEEACK